MAREYNNKCPICQDYIFEVPIVLDPCKHCLHNNCRVSEQRNKNIFSERVCPICKGATNGICDEKTTLLVYESMRDNNFKCEYCNMEIKFGNLQRHIKICEKYIHDCQNMEF